MARAVAMLRDRSGMSQEVLAETLQRMGFDVSRDKVMNWERGRSDPSLSELQALMKIAGVPSLFIPADTQPILNGNGFDRGLKEPIRITRPTAGKPKNAATLPRNVSLQSE